MLRAIHTKVVDETKYLQLSLPQWSDVNCDLNVVNYWIQNVYMDKHKTPAYCTCNYVVWGYSLENFLLHEGGHTSENFLSPSWVHYGKKCAYHYSCSLRAVGEGTKNTHA